MNNRIDFKISLSITFFVLCIILCSCKKAPELIEQQTVSASNESLISSTESPPESNKPHSVSEVVSQYSDLYHEKHIYQDQYIKQKYLFIGDKNVVELFVVEGVNQTKVIEKDNIERVEHNSLPEFDEIKIYDKTNQYISVFVNSKEADKILKMIDTSNNENNTDLFNMNVSEDE